MMEPTSWQPINGERLKFMRHAAGFDIQKFAKINAISVAQLKLLEEGGDRSHFYSPAIKASVGRKLLRRLGDNNAPGVSEQAPQTATGQAHASADQMHPRVTPDEARKLETLRNLDKVAADSVRDLRVRPSERSVGAVSSFKRRNSYVLSLLAVAVLVPIGNANFDDSLQWAASVLQPPTGQATAEAEVKRITPAEAILIPAAVPAPGTDSSQVDAPVATPAPVSIEPAAEPAPRVAPVAVQDQRSKCHWSDQEIKLQPLVVRTEGNYVHFVASGDVRVCVLDGQQKTSVLSLKAGDAKSVRGAAPWHVYSRNMSELKVFFQGYHVPVPDSKITQISLMER